MSLALMTLLIASGAYGAGLLGSLTGLGGGMVIVPLLTIGFGVDLHYAIGASLVSIIATSSGAAAAYVREGYTNLRVGMLLEVATTLGALGGAWAAGVIPARWIAILFGVVLLATTLAARHPDDDDPDLPSSALAKRLRLSSDYPTAEGPQHYPVRNVRIGFLLMGLAGILSALLGIGSGVVKVLAMDRAMGLPFKVSTTTSNFMIGVTAAASAGIYLHRGWIDPHLALPVILGVLAGALTGARILARAPVKRLRLLFTAVAAILAVEMLYKGLTGGIG